MIFHENAKGLLVPKSGTIFMRCEWEDTGELIEERSFENVITEDAGYLAARLFKNNTEPTRGLFYLALGTGAGDSAVVPDPQNPPLGESDQRALAAEVARRSFHTMSFVNPSTGLVSTIPTKLVDMTATFEGHVANSPLQEMGVIGAPQFLDGTPAPNPEVKGSDPTIDVSDYDILVNYKTFKVFNKPVGSKLTITWRFQF